MLQIAKELDRGIMEAVMQIKSLLSSEEIAKQFRSLPSSSLDKGT